MTRRTAGFACLAGFVAAVAAANWLTAHYGLVSVGFGLVATAGTYAAGITFALRDGIQEWLPERWWVPVGILAGALLSYAVSTPKLAFASGVTFLIAEATDWAVYTPLRRRNRTAAVAASNIVGFTVDTLLFLHLAGFPTTPRVVAGQLLGKAWMTVAALAVIAAAQGGRRAVSRRQRVTSRA